MKPMRLSLRLAVSVGALGILLVCAVLGASYLALVQQLDNHAREHLRGKLVQAQHVLIEAPDVEGIGARTGKLADLLIGHDEQHIAVSRPGSDVAIASYSAIARESLLRVRHRVQPNTYLDWRAGDGKRLLSLAAQGKVQNGETVAVVVTIDRQGDDKLQASVFRTILLALPIALIFVMVGAWWIAWHGLTPLLRAWPKMGCRRNCASWPPLSTGCSNASKRESPAWFNSPEIWRTRCAPQSQTCLARHR